MNNRQILRDHGALEADLDSLLAYLENKFVKIHHEASENDAFLEKWEFLAKEIAGLGAAEAINRYVAGSRRIEFQEPDGITFEIYPSLAGRIPIILLKNISDFEIFVTAMAYKGEYRREIHQIGAMFLFGQTTRFIILSDKPYSNVPAAAMGLSENEWRRKSYLIRREHECAHYFTKRFYGSSRNNLHDELIADYMGYTAAFGKFQADWFTKALGLHGNVFGDGEGQIHIASELAGETAGEIADESAGRFQVYTRDLSATGAEFLKSYTFILAQALEKWSLSEEATALTRTEIISRLCEKSLLR